MYDTSSWFLRAACRCPGLTPCFRHWEAASRRSTAKRRGSRGAGGCARPWSVVRGCGSQSHQSQELTHAVSRHASRHSPHHKSITYVGDAITRLEDAITHLRDTISHQYRPSSTPSLIDTVPSPRSVFHIPARPNHPNQCAPSSPRTAPALAPPPATPQSNRTPPRALPRTPQPD